MAEFQLTDEKKENVKEAFELFDTIGDGKIFFSQAGDVMRAMGENPTIEDVNKGLGSPSAEDLKTKRMATDEFFPIYEKVVKDGSMGTYEDFVEGLRVFDKDGNGTVMGAEIRHVLTTLGEKLGPVQVNLMMQGQEDTSGSINYEAFSKFLLSEEMPKKE